MANSPQPATHDRLRLVTSRNNAGVKELRRLFRDASPNEKGEIAVEGVHLVEEAIRSGLRIPAVFFADSARERAHKLLPQLPKQTETLVLPDEVFSSAVPTETPQGIAALVRVNTSSFADLMRPQPALLVVAAGLQDPGNLGTIARSGEAFWATGLMLAEMQLSVPGTGSPCALQPDRCFDCHQRRWRSLWHSQNSGHAASRCWQPRRTRALRSLRPT